jgi:hypothetical protein
MYTLEDEENDIDNSRKGFVKAFLSEMPTGTIPRDYSRQIVDYIHEKQPFLPTIKLSNDLYKMEGPDLIYYWYEENDNILLGAEFLKSKKGLVVNFIGKPNKGKPPYASDLYNAVLTDLKNNNQILHAVIISDRQLSDEGFNIWARLLKDGHKLLVYDYSQPGSNYIKIKSIAELNQYFKHDDENFKKYRYVLSEDGRHYAEIMGCFSLRRLRETSGIL